MNDWEVARSTGRCAATGRELAEGEEFYAVLLQGPEGLERKDFSLDAWTAPPPESLCHWRGHIPVKDKKRHTISAVDHELLTQLFLRLEDQDSEPAQQFRFVLALLLMRKKILKYEQIVRDDDREYWQMRLVSEQSVHQVLNPRLSNEQVDRLGTQLLGVLTGEIDSVEALDRMDSNEEMPTPPESEDEVATS
jgi:hypothetical protein